MGIYCEINLFKPVDGVFVPGEIVSGMIKYAVDKDTTVTQTTVSLKGKGYIRIADRVKRRKNRRHAFTNREDYVDIDRILQRDLRGTIITPGQYETNFYFQLPMDIPQSFCFEDSYSSYSIRCSIAYYIRIKFKRPGMFKFNKHFRKEISVVSELKPRLPITPTIFTKQKKLFKIFTNQPNIVNIKTNIENCVIQPGGKIELNYEVFNDTNVNIKAVETKLREVHTFKPIAHNHVMVGEDVPYTETKTSQINSGETQNMFIVINVPSHIASVENSRIVSRDYFVVITAVLPAPHYDAILEIPVQIGDLHSTIVEPDNSNPPPTYWETMGEDDGGVNEDLERTASVA